jgi:hypothetical protein
MSVDLWIYLVIIRISHIKKIYSQRDPHIKIHQTHIILFYLTISTILKVYDINL